ncbi:MAG TPA: C4-type zinc ribbon domain-containing protein [Oligoflexia bacterium]|nr:C4-type zinc ribbon domain-containing protein [Oligoflexia bacterium]HMP26589.1 C4-type zinc ribbon domain-containing protein [Oligoflexia bacterium]
MNVPNLLKEIYNLSQIDSQIARIRNERLQFEQKAKNIADALAKLQTEFNSQTTILKEKKFTYQKEEHRIRDEDAKLIARRKATSTLGNYKLQEAANKEIEHAARQLKLQEEQLIKSLLQIDELEKQTAATETKLIALKTQNNQIASEQQDTLTNLNQREQQCLAKRNQLASNIDQKLLQIYERVREKIDFNPVVSLNNNACTICFMKISPQNMMLITKGDQLVKCSGCGRILISAELATALVNNELTIANKPVA